MMAHEVEKLRLGAIELSRIVYGMWRIGDDEDTSAQHIQAKIEACLAQGITSFDQADIYGGYTAEALLGNVLRVSPGLRDQMEIITKCDIIAPVGRHAGARVKHYDTTPAHITASVEASLRDLATDRIDLLLLHRPDPLMNPAETGACLDALVASGKVLAVGVSNFRPWDWQLLQSAMETRLVTNQIEVSLLHHVAVTNGDISFLQSQNVMPMAWSPLAGGRLLAEAPAPLRARMDAIAGAQGSEWSAVAVAWLLRHPAKILPVMGTNSLSRISRLSEACRIEMDRQMWFELYTDALGHEVA